MVSVKKELRRLTMPIFIDIALVLLLGAVDTVMLSQYSDDAVAAVGLDNQLVSLVFLVYNFVAMGAAILCAQYFGAGTKTRFVQIAGIALGVNTLLALMTSAVLWMWAEPILRAFGLRDGLMADGVLYLRITGALSFFQAISLTISGALRSTGRPLYPMLATVAVNILNIGGNYALIFGHWGCPAMGVEGAAWATAGSRIVATLILLCTLPSLWPRGRKVFTNPLRIALHPMYSIRRQASVVTGNFRPFPWQELRNLFKVGIPAMSEELSYALSQIVITYFINKISTEALTTKIYCSTVITFILLLSQSVVQGGDILVGQYVGQLRYRAAYILGNYIKRFAMRLTLAVAAVLAIGGRFILEALTDNQWIIETGTYIFIIDWFLSAGRVKNVFACGTLRAAGDVVYPVIVGVIFQWTVAVGLAWVVGIPMGFGLLGFWVAFALDENLRGIVLMRRWHSKRWQGKAFTA